MTDRTEQKSGKYDISIFIFKWKLGLVPETVSNVHKSLSPVENSDDQSQDTISNEVSCVKLHTLIMIYEELKSYLFIKFELCRKSVYMFHWFPTIFCLQLISLNKNLLCYKKI